jgi:signal transduction histidine kinase
MKNIKNRIAWKLTLYFSVSLILFSAVIGGVFMLLFKNHAIALNKTTLTAKAVSMAETLSELMTSSSSGSSSGPNANGGMMNGVQGGYGVYLRFLDDIAMTDVWVVDENLDLITSRQSAGQEYDYAALPSDAKDIVSKVFLGQTILSEGFSDVLAVPTLTVGTPILSGDTVIGALLLHAPVSGVDEGIFQGFEMLLLSISIALVLSIILSILLALTFSKPLKQMKNTAVRLTSGDYTAKTGVAQKDEIGELASSIDVLSERLDLASHESERLSKLRRDFIANISHELRTPVTVIRGSLEALNDGIVSNPDQIRDYYQQMLRESISLQRLVDDLLDLSRLQNTDFQIEMKPVNLCEVLDDTIRSARHLAAPKQIRILLETNVPVCAVSGDYGRLRQMFLIVLDNAIKFSPPESQVTVSLNEKGVVIKDSGAGIPPEDLPYVFDRFYKGKSAENINGTGLGLAIAKQIADRHHIEITAENGQDFGCLFRFGFKN